MLFKWFSIFVIDKLLSDPDTVQRIRVHSRPPFPLDSDGSNDISSHEETLAAVDRETKGLMGTAGIATTTCDALLDMLEQTLWKQYRFTLPDRTLTTSPAFTNAVELALLGRSASTR